MKRERQDKTATVTIAPMTGRAGGLVHCWIIDRHARAFSQFDRSLSFFLIPVSPSFRSFCSFFFKFLFFSFVYYSSAIRLEYPVLGRR